MTTLREVLQARLEEDGLPQLFLERKALSLHFARLLRHPEALRAIAEGIAEEEHLDGERLAAELEIAVRCALETLWRSSPN
jgi:hypothetical protein